MVFIHFFKKCFWRFVDEFGLLYKNAALQNANLTCNIHYTAKVNDSTLGKFNVFFDHVIVHGCEIGSHTYIQKRTTIVNARVGKFCSIASGVTIGPGIHYTKGVSTHPAFYLKNTPLAFTYSDEDEYKFSLTVQIGHDVWIGQNAIILDGVNIGTGAIVAAGAVVTKDIEPYTIVGGVPAKILKKRFDEEICNKLLGSEWWNKDDEVLKQYYRSFKDPLAFIDILNRSHDEIR